MPMSAVDEERTALLRPRSEDGGDDHRSIDRGLLWSLYTSHFLSTWNMRSYEFTVILLFAAAYPDSLLPTSIRGVLTNGATLLLSPSIGSWVDRNASRFHTMQITIVVQRACIVAGCVLWPLLFLAPQSQTMASSVLPNPASYLSKNVIIATLILLGIVERVCAVGNNLVMERDWVPTVASAASSNTPLHQLNAVMRRIDLVSKILAPVFVSAIAIKTSTPVLIAVTAGTNLATVGVELATARRAWDGCAALRVSRESEPKDVVPGASQDGDMVRFQPEEKDENRGLALYFGNRASLASLSAALQSFSVLSLSGPMTTYLLTRHFPLTLITSARTAISCLEIGSTILFPLLAAFLTSHPLPFLSDPMSVLGLGGVTLQLALLTPCLLALSALPTTSNNPDTDPAGTYPVLIMVFFACLGLSRLGHWTHNMAAQQIVQTRIATRHRAEFSGVETAFVSAAEMGRWACAALWSRPDEFWGLAAAGLGSVVAVWGLFTWWACGERREGGDGPSSTGDRWIDYT